MIKAALITGFLVAFCLAVWIYRQRQSELSKTDEKVPVENAEKSQIVVKDFQIFRYYQDHLVMEVAASEAYFQDSDRVTLHKNVKLVRINWETGESENLLANKGTIVLKPKPFLQLIDNAEIELAELEQDVRVELKNHTMLTDKATYDATRDIVFGQNPVRITGPNRIFDGAKGFRYNFRTELLEVFGRVTGKETKVPL